MEAPVVRRLAEIDLEEWQEENDVFFTGCVNFLWNVPVDWEGVMTDHEGAGFDWPPGDDADGTRKARRLRDPVSM